MSNESFANVSDDDFEKFLESGEVPTQQEPLDEALDTSDSEELDNSTEDDVELDSDAQEQPLEEEADQTVAEEETDTSEDDTDADSDTVTEDEEDADTSKIPEELAELFKPFKAAGRDFQAKSVDEIKRLMQMGVDYSEKVQGFKVHRKTIKTLEQHNIDADKLNLLIDVSKGNPQAIAKLIQDHKINPMDLEVEEGTNYVPSDFSVSESQVELDEVIERIQSTATFTRTSDVISNQWDSASKEVVFKSPALIERLNEQIANGTFDRVMQEVTRARVFGGLQGVSDIEAYHQVGMRLQQEGAFTKAPTERVTTAPTDTSKETAGQKKKVAISGKKAPTKPVAPKVDYVNMSDDQFEQLLNQAKY